MMIAAVIDLEGNSESAYVPDDSKLGDVGLFVTVNTGADIYGEIVEFE